MNNPATGNPKHLSQDLGLDAVGWDKYYRLHFIFKDGKRSRFPLNGHPADPDSWVFQYIVCRCMGIPWPF